MVKSNKTTDQKKIRKLFNLGPDDIAFIKHFAQKKRISESEVVRGALKHFRKQLEPMQSYDPFEKLIGMVKAGPHEADKHDKVLYE